jgi:hypothetical protein
MQLAFLIALCPPAQDMKAQAEAMMPQLEKLFNIICVDRSILPLYPYWVKMVNAS